MPDYAFPAVPGDLVPGAATLGVPDTFFTPGPLTGGVNVVLPGNRLVPGDCDFETALTGDWSAFLNCSIAQSTAQAFTGTHSLAITATASSAVQVAINFPVPNIATGVVTSCWAYSPNSGRTINVAISGVAGLIGGPVVNLTQATWTPCASNYALPAGSGPTSTMFVQFLNMNASETVYLDLVYAAQTEWQILAALSTPPLSATPLFADLTPFTRADQTISYNRGRADEVSQVQAGTSQFTLDNMVIPGAWSPGNPRSPFAGWQTGRLIQLNAADEGGNFTTRFTGFITDIDPAWQGGPALSSTVPVTAQDILSLLSRKNTLRTMLEEEILNDTPACLYTLADPSGATTASDSSGNASPPLAIRKYGVNGTLTFGGTGFVGASAQGFTSSPLQAVTSAVSWPSNWAGNVQLEGKLQQQVSAAAGFTFEIFTNMGFGLAAHEIAVPISLANSRTGAYVCCGLMTATANMAVGYGTGYNTTPAMSAGVAAFPNPLLFTVTVSGTTATLYVNSNQVATHTVPAGFTADTLYVNGVPGGGFASGSVNVASGIFGGLNCAAVYPGIVLTTTRMLAKTYAGAFQNQGNFVSLVAANILRYAAIPAALTSLPYPGVSYVDAFEINGQTPLSVLQVYQGVDGGVFYVTAGGVIVFQDRAARYAAQITPAIILQPGQYQEDLAYTTTTQFQVNDATLSNNNLPGGVRATNTASVNNAGTFANGDPQSPVSGPWYSFPYLPQPSGLVASPDVLTDAAQYQVNTYGTPAPRSPAVNIDLATQPGGGTNISRALAYGLDVGSVLQLPSLPSTAPSAVRSQFLYAEGVAESFTRDDNGVNWMLSLNTSPASQSAAWVPGDPNLGVLDSTAIVGRGTDGAKQPGIVRDQAGGTFTGTGTTGTLTWPNLPTAGAKVLVAVAAAGTATPTLVQDNGSSPVTFTLDVSNVSTHGLWIYRGDAITQPSSGSYQVTVAFASGVAMTVMGQSYTGAAAGGPGAAKNNGTASSKSVSTGKVTPASPGSLFYAAFGDASALSNEVIKLTGSGFLNLGRNNNGTTGVPAATADQIPAGPATGLTCTWTIGDTVRWNAAMAAYAPTSIPSAFSAAEYVGPPYPVPAFSTSMNRTGNVGANDMRGLASNVALAVSPPAGTAQQVSLAQSIPNNADTTVQFDTLLNDTAGGFNLSTSATNYTVMLPGEYLLMASVVFASNATGDRLCWFTQNGTTITGQESIDSVNGQPTGVFVTAQVICAMGDVLQLHGQQTSGGALALSTTGGGTFFSVLWMGT